MTLPPTSILIDSYPLAIYRIVRFHSPPPRLIIDLCSGEGRWTYLMRMAGEYQVVMCDKEKGARIHVLCDLRAPPFREEIADVIMADLPYPFFKGKAYKIRLRTVDEYVDLVKGVRASALSLLRSGGKLIMKTSEFYRRSKVVPGIWLIHDVMGSSLDLVDVVVLFTKPWIYLMGNFKRAVRMHNYLVVYQKREERAATVKEV